MWRVCITSVAGNSQAKPCLQSIPIVRAAVFCAVFIFGTLWEHLKFLGWHFETGAWKGWE